MSTRTEEALPFEPGEWNDRSVRYFSSSGCVVDGDGRHEVWVGGTLIGTYTDAHTDRGARNAILVGLCQGPKVHFGRLAAAFEIHEETLRLIRRECESEGLAAVLHRYSTGRPPKRTPEVVARMEACFAEGRSAREVHRMLEKEGLELGHSTVRKARSAWKKKQRRTRTEADPDPQPSLPLPEEPEPEPEENDACPDVTEVEPALPRGGRGVQHAGTLLMQAVAGRHGLHGLTQRAAGDRVPPETLRWCLDAVVAALSVGEGCVEGVRRLETASAPVLLRCESGVPSASWVRRVLKSVAEKDGSGRLQLGIAGHYLREQVREEGPAIFYVDNHLRTYTGKHKVRRGWRMQDRRAVPGTTDYYLHDEDGRPLYRYAASDNRPLTAMLGPIVKLVKLALPGERLLVAFDRAGAYPEQLAELRDLGVELVTYERRPYAVIPKRDFTEEVELGGEVYGLAEPRRANLGKGRGRVRRIGVRTPRGDQINLLAWGEVPAAALLEVMVGRWRQENAFKHGASRWGINQLDGRKAEPYAPEAVIPNPARRRLDRALKIAREREGELRRKLARAKRGSEVQAGLRAELDEVLAAEEELEAQRPELPSHTTVEEAGLSGKLVRHERGYKGVMDSIRIVCANAESDLAGELAVHLERPREAKKVLANLLAAPGDVRVNARTVTVTLHPAGHAGEREAIEALLDTVTRWKLTLPGDPSGRHLRFKSQIP